MCSDASRDRTTICVVSEPRDVSAIERTGSYHGLYHVLGGVISPMDKIGPDQLHVREPCIVLASGEVREVILATNLGRGGRDHHDLPRAHYAAARGEGHPARERFPGEATSSTPTRAASAAPSRRGREAHFLVAQEASKFLPTKRHDFNALDIRPRRCVVQ